MSPLTGLANSAVGDDVVKEFAARNVLLHEKRLLVVAVRNQVVELDDVRVVEQLHDLDFALNALGLVVQIVHQRPVDDFDGKLQREKRKKEKKKIIQTQRQLGRQPSRTHDTAHLLAREHICRQLHFRERALAQRAPDLVLPDVRQFLLGRNAAAAAALCRVMCHRVCFLPSSTER
jgi:hypothetical protein